MSKRGSTGTRDDSREELPVENWDPDFLAMVYAARPEKWVEIDATLAALRGSGPPDTALAYQLPAHQAEIAEYLGDFPPITEVVLSPEAEQIQAEIVALESMEAGDSVDQFPLSFLDLLGQEPLRDMVSATESRLSIDQFVQARWQQDPPQVHIEPVGTGILGEPRQQWVGPPGLQAPFSPDEFTQAFRDAGWVGTAEHGVREATIADVHYLITETDAEATLPGTGFTIRSEHFAQVTNPARYEASAQSAAYPLARELRVGGANGEEQPVPRVYAFGDNGNQVKVTEYLDNATALEDVFPRLENSSAQELRRLDPGGLKRVVLFQYLMGSPGKDVTQCLVDPQTFDFYDTGWEQSLRLDGDKMFGSTALDLYIAQAGGSANARLPKPLLREYLSHEAQVMNILRQYRLEEGIPGMERRFRHLEVLANNPGLTATVEDLGLVELRQSHMSYDQLLADYAQYVQRLRNISGANS